MGKYSSIIAGAVIALIGLWGLIVWWPDFVQVLCGSIPAMLVFGGIIAVIAGLSELSDASASKKT